LGSFTGRETPWTASNLAKAVSEFRYGARGNPTAEGKAAFAKWKAEEKAVKAKEMTEFAVKWAAMPREERDELRDLWLTGDLYGKVEGRFIARITRRAYRKTLLEKD